MRYFEELAATTEVREGWVLGDAGRFFYPITLTTEDTLARTDALIADPGLNPTLRRVLVDAGDEVRRRLACLEKYAT